MTTDLHPAADSMARLVADIPDEALEGPTPCTDYTVAALADHVGGLAVAFTAAARKDLGELTAGTPGPRPVHLENGWRDRISRDLVVLADAWADPAAWTGMTQAGGVDLPGEVAGAVALSELVVHGWDLARATRRSFAPDAQSLARVLATVSDFRGEDHGAIPGLYGPVVGYDGGSPIDRLVALTGRDPMWRPPGDHGPS